MSSPEKKSLSTDYIEIPGDELEGGGQILRISLGLASLLNKKIHIFNVRGKRPKPGLQRQHLIGMTSLASLHTGYPGCLTGAAIGSTDVIFDPSSPTHPHLPFSKIEIGSAGSIGLIIQAILPCITFYPYRSAPPPLDLFTSENIFSNGTEKVNSYEDEDEADLKTEKMYDVKSDFVKMTSSITSSSTSSPPQSPPSLLPEFKSPLIQHCINIVGGTDVSWSPSTRYFENILIPLLNKMGNKIKIETLRHGFYPKGCGEAKITVTPLNSGEFLNPIILLDRGEVESISIKSYISRVPKNIGDKIVRMTLEKLKEEIIQLPRRVDVQVFDVTSKSFASGVWLEVQAKTTTGCKLWASSVGAFKKPSEDVVKEATDVFIRDWNAGGCVDEFTQDQLLVFMALAKGMSQVRTGEISLHSRTAMELIRKIAGVEFSVRKDGESNIVSCNGLGYVSK